MKFNIFERKSVFIRNSLAQTKSHVEAIISNVVISDGVEQTEVNELNFYYNIAKNQFSDFNNSLNQLMAEEDEEFNVDRVLAIQEDLTEMYKSIEILAKQYQSNDSQLVSPSKSNASQSNLKLPRLALKPFNGAPDQWLTFFNLFDASVNKNSDINQSQKMQYLLLSLQGEPLNLIKNLQITPENYEVAWKILKQRYDNNRKIISYHVNSIIDLPHVQTSTSISLRSFISKFHESDQALIALKHDIKPHNIILSSLLLRKLDNQTRKRFEDDRADSQKFPNTEELMVFLEKECNRLEAVSLSSQVCPTQHSNTKPSNTKGTDYKQNRTMLIASKTKCKFCAEEGHTIYGCPEFKNLTVQDKFNFVKQKHFCFNCLGSAHSVNECKSKKVCDHCKKKHHTWLHLSEHKTIATSSIKPHFATNGEQSSSKSSPPMEPSKTAVVALSRNKGCLDRPTTILLGTTLVQVTSPNGNSLVIRAVVDSASMISCITEETARLLSLERVSDKYSRIDGLSSCHVKSKGVSKLDISALNGAKVSDNHPVVILDRITSNLPHSQIPQDVKDRFKNLVLADPTFDTPSSIDILLGADLYSKIMTGDKLVIGENLPAAMNSIFGYILIGSSPALQFSQPDPYSGIIKDTNNSSDISLLTIDTHDLHQTVQRFWTHEEPPFKAKPTPDDIFCEDHFNKTHSRESSGRYVVRLPLKDDHPHLGDSSTIAQKRFLSLEKRLNSNLELKKKYSACINELLECGDMEQVNTPPTADQEHFFLPHHAVIKEESSSTKVRIVFDASARSSSGISLNDILHPGPKLQNEIIDLLILFRSYPFICCSDIRQMFRRILIHPEDRNYQLLYWREEPNKPLLIYRLTTVVFGFTSSPYLAMRTLKQLVNDEGHMFPGASEAINKQIYVDDLILGADTLENALTLQAEAIQLLSKGGFDLRKWTSNCSQLVRNVPESHREKSLPHSDPNHQMFKVLGVKWIPESDEFVYIFNLPDTKITKRLILSTVARIYDICGWLTPVTFWTKSLLQLLWTLGLQWDEQVPADIAEKWKRFISQLPCLNKLKIHRYIALYNALNVQLHGFCDGSEAGYSAVVYVRVVCPDESIKIYLLIAKSRVSPLKRISIPRLELCGAHLLANLLQYAVPILSQRCSISLIKAWCDSSVVLSWIHTPPYRLKVYVANRVAQIQESTPTNSWSYVPTDINPADCASRGLLPSSLPDHDLWWHGPSWLQQSQEYWPNRKFTPIVHEELPEIKQNPLPILLNIQSTTNDLLGKYSSWNMLLRIFTYVMRFINNCKGLNKVKGNLKLKELKEAEWKICKLIQQSEFKEELQTLSSGKQCPSRFRHLSPFIDNVGLIRVGGRLQHSNLSYESKHPILLPKSHHVVNLIIDFYHLKYLHAGPQSVQAAISQKFWIISARSVIRSRIFKCMRCCKCNPKLSKQKMGDLPSQRVTPSRVFENCGTDYLGPFYVKTSALRRASKINVFICIFVCFSVKAVHLEVVTSLNTEAYIAALTRFVSRRGLCRNIYSDCGKNYVGAANEIKNIMKNFLSQDETRKELHRFSMENQIQFHFLPPAAPHQGGLWERTVQSVKYHLRRVIGDQILTLEEFTTLSIRIEAILNSRPITPLSSDPSEVDCLTPGHFLIGGPLLSLPEHDWAGVFKNHLSRWKMVQSLLQCFWKRWQKQYLYTLQERGKWKTVQPNIKVGDLVLIHEPNQPPLSWRMGRVTSTSPGPDGIVRVVHLRTSKGPLSRPITKVSPLPHED